MDIPQIKKKKYKKVGIFILHFPEYRKPSYLDPFCLRAPVLINPLQDNKILELSKLKQIADNI